MAFARGTAAQRRAGAPAKAAGKAKAGKAKAVGPDAMVLYTGPGEAGGADGQPPSSILRAGLAKAKGKQGQKRQSALIAARNKQREEDAEAEAAEEVAPPPPGGKKLKAGRGKGAGRGKMAKAAKAAAKGSKRAAEESSSAPTAKQRRQGHWYDGKSKELLLRCFEKELALTLKIFFTDQEILSRRRCAYFRRNYGEVPELRKDCDAVLEEINQMAGPRVEEAIAKSGKEGVDQTLLDPHMLKLEESRGFMKFQWPAFWASLGDRVDYRRGFLGRTGRFGSGTAGAIRAALADWWYEDIRAWVVRAEQSISSAQMSRLLFNGKDDHLELKVSGMGRTGSLVLAETDGLEVLAQLVDERLRWWGIRGRNMVDHPPPAESQTPWTFRITDGLRKTRAELLLKRVLEMEPDPGQPVAIPEDKRVILKAVQDSASRDGGDVRWLNRLIEMKAELGLIPAREAGDIVQERNLCLPYARVAGSSQEFESDDWFEILPTPFLVGSMPAPEDEPLLKHADTGRNLMELEFLEGGGVERVCRIEVMARVTTDWKRPYGIIWQNETGSGGSEVPGSQS